MVYELFQKFWENWNLWDFLNLKVYQFRQKDSYYINDKVGLRKFSKNHLNIQKITYFLIFFIKNHQIFDFSHIYNSIRVNLYSLYILLHIYTHTYNILMHIIPHIHISIQISIVFTNIKHVHTFIHTYVHIKEHMLFYYFSWSC